MNILILNWRDIKNPKSGGAEILTHEIAKSWIKMGHQITVFSSYFKNSLPLEIVDGVRIIRKGHPDTRFLFASVHFSAFIYYLKNSKNFDLLIDEIHGIPFFTPLYVKGKKVVLICEVAGNLWVKMLGSFFGRFGRLIEQFYLKVIYRGMLFLTISESTKQELIKEGVNPKNIFILPMGITVPRTIRNFKKEKTTTLIFVGRLTKSKGIEDAIKALSIASNTFGDLKLWIVGDGEKSYLEYLKKISRKFKVESKVIFFGYVPQDKKFELIGRAHILLAPSLKEGWGLTVPEAALVGTPSIVYNSPGLRDVLKGSRFKTITKSNTPESLSDEIVKVLSKKDVVYKKLNPKDFSWDKTATFALKVIDNE